MAGSWYSARGGSLSALRGGGGGVGAGHMRRPASGGASAAPPAGEVLAGEGTGAPGAGAPRRAKRTGSPPVSRTCVRVDVPDEVVTVSLLTSRLSCCCGGPRCRAGEVLPRAAVPGSPHGPRRPPPPWRPPAP